MSERGAKIDRHRRWSAAVLGSCFLFGNLLGAMSAATGDSDQTTQIREYLRDYLLLTAESGVAPAVWEALWHHGCWFLFCAVFCLSILRVIFLPFLFALRGFLFAFAISCFVRIFGVSGLFPAGLLLGIPASLWMPAMLIYAACLTKIESYSFLKKTRPEQIIPIPGREVRNGLVLCFLLIFLCISLECLLLPALLPGVVHFIK